jgi:hypothetical protein
LPKLTSLRFGPRRIGDSKVLRALGVHRLTHVTLSGTPSPAIDLTPLADAHALRSLRLLGHGTHTEAAGGANAALEHLYLYNVPLLQSVGGFSSLPAVKSLFASEG